MNLRVIVVFTAMVNFPTRPDLSNVGIRWYFPCGVSDWVLLSGVG